ncbi:hypothetical protein Ancab_021967 [Ancistrocladus abbreviatus]
MREASLDDIMQVGLPALYSATSMDHPFGNSIGDSNIVNMNRIFLDKLIANEAKELQELSKKLAASFASDETEVVNKLIDMEYRDREGRDALFSKEGLIKSTEGLDNGKCEFSLSIAEV